MIAAQPLGRLSLNRPLKILMGLSLAGIAGIIWRFAAGLGASTALNDGYPWGLWIAFDVVTGTALACGGYAVALLVYAFNRGQCPSVDPSRHRHECPGLHDGRPVGGARCRSPLRPLESAALLLGLEPELRAARGGALHHDLYAGGVAGARTGRTGALAAGAIVASFHARAPAHPGDRSLTWIIAFAMLLPTMHQSSLGTLMVLSGPRLHELWQTSWLPLLF